MIEKNPLEKILERNPDLEILSSSLDTQMFIIIGRALYKDLNELYFSSETEFPFNPDDRRDTRSYNLYSLWDKFPSVKGDAIVGMCDSDKTYKSSVLSAILKSSDSENLSLIATVEDMEVYRLK